MVGIAELIGTTTAAMARVLSSRGQHGGMEQSAGVVTTSDVHIPTDSVLRSVLRHGVRLQMFTGIATQ